MQTLYQSLDQRLNNRRIDFANQTATVAAGSFVMFRLRVTAISAGASMTVSMDVTFPGGNVKHFDLPVNALGSFQRGGWAEISVKVRMRYLEGVVPQMRVKFGTEYYDIESVQNVETRDREMVLMCREIVS